MMQTILLRGEDHKTAKEENPRLLYKLESYLRKYLIRQCGFQMVFSILPTR